MLKHSKQREAIKLFLIGRKDHPTAETVYTSLKQEYPNISLGTVYRNLALLTDLGEIQKISSANGSDRYDGNPRAHCHFFCSRCDSVLDLDMKNFDSIEGLAQEDFDGTIEGHVTYFYGLCPKCYHEKIEKQKKRRSRK